MLSRPARMQTDDILSKAIPIDVSEYDSPRELTLQRAADRVSFKLPAQIIKDHLVLMRAFYELRNCVERRSDIEELPRYTEKACDVKPLQPRQEKEDKPHWVAFLHRAVYRFELYLNLLFQLPEVQDHPLHYSQLDLPHKHIMSTKLHKTKTFNVPSNCLPPLDVALVWHAYRLNPSRIYEDAYRDPSRAALALFEFPLEQLVPTIDDRTWQIDAPSSASTWEQMTDFPFNPLVHDPSSLTDGNMEEILISCPRCSDQNLSSWETLGRPGWKTKCPHCGFEFGRNELLGRRFLSDVTKWCEGGNDSSGFRLRGGVISAQNSFFIRFDPYAPILYPLFENHREVDLVRHGQAGTRRLSLSAKEMQGRRPMQDRQIPEKFGEAHGFDIERMMSAICEVSRAYPQPKGVKTTVLKCTNLLQRYYMDSHPLSGASLDLAASIQRQFRFLEDAYALGWLDDPDSAQIPLSIHRYREWLVLIPYSKGMLAPTLDIDLVWHSHMLSSDYMWDMRFSLELFLDHTDKVDERTMAKAVKDTEDIWEQAYGRSFLTGSKTHRGGMLHRFKQKLATYKSDSTDEETEPEMKVSRVQEVQLVPPETFHELPLEKRAFYESTALPPIGRASCVAGVVPIGPFITNYKNYDPGSYNVRGAFTM